MYNISSSTKLKAVGGLITCQSCVLVAFNFGGSSEGKKGRLITRTIQYLPDRIKTIPKKDLSAYSVV